MGGAMMRGVVAGGEGLVDYRVFAKQCWGGG